MLVWITTKLKETRLWRLIWFCLIAAELLTAGCVSILSLIINGRITFDYLLTGFVTVSFVAPLVFSILFLLLKELRKSEERFRAFAEFTWDWETWLRPDGRFEYITPSCRRITGYDPDEFTADPELVDRIVYPDDRQAVIEHLALHNKDTGDLHFDFRIITRDGEVRWIEHHCRQIFDTDGTWLGRRICNRDISRRKRAEAEKEKVVQELQQALAEVRTLRGFIPICAHCKKIRDDEGYWKRIELYIEERTEAQFSHSICADCLSELYPDYTEGEP
ncbi:MAG: PAS domain-containing protein [Deltaproteobacteria bacterium]|nr:PAS domain-containing protein [Deltaproteobacteria bacterium]MBF0524464.1 PAS domain-containing protein [Deltaproteobacteria bacterium]